ncbi:MAG: hypothetical protein N3F66_05750 [Spirochaetes bacterium]|nr:hypothetical protein [Spirochaetota bacterium]
MKKFFIILCVCMICTHVNADPLLELAATHLYNKEYYHAITECMRYQYCYPDGSEYPRSMLIMARAYFLGGNYYRATDIAYECYQKYAGTLWGEQALYNLATMRLLDGSAFFAYRNFQEYFTLYPQGKLNQQARLNFIYTQVVLNYYDDAKKDLDAFLTHTNDKDLRDEAEKFKIAFDNFNARQKKSVWVSLGGSLVVPGFGHFYTGKISTGLLSLASTVSFAALAYRGYMHDNNFQLVFFALAGFTFYQYSLVSAVINVYEYNSDASFKEAIKLSVMKRF